MSETPFLKPLISALLTITTVTPMATPRIVSAARLAQPDFARPLGHRHQHDVHDHDATDHERHDDDPGHDGHQNAIDARPEALHTLGRVQYEVVVLLRSQMPATPHNAFGLLHRVVHLHFGARLHEEGIEDPRRIHQVLRG